MASDLEHTLNEAAYYRLKGDIEKQYPQKQFVAFGRGLILADSADFDELLAKIRALGWEPLDVMVIRVGDEPEPHGVIFSPLLGVTR